MAGPSRLLSLVRLAVGASLLAIAIGGVAAPANAAAALPRWTGGVDLYRTGVFTTQKTWLWCTAADLQIMRNIATGASDHAAASQQRYFDYMRAHDRYAIPVSDGTDPGGWTAGLRHFVDDRYRVVASTSFDTALRSAVTGLRRTGLPVAIAVMHGDHGWVITGFTATAAPAVTTRFTVTSVRVVGPLWGLQSRTYGYDMKPDTKLTPSQLATFFTPWHYARVRMAWEGEWVSIQPVGAAAATSRPAATPGPTAVPVPTQLSMPTPTPLPTVPATLTPSPAAVPTRAAMPTPTLVPATGVAEVAGPAGSGSGGAGAADAAVAVPAAATASSDAVMLFGVLVVILGVAVMVGGWAAARRRRARRGDPGTDAMRGTSRRM